MKKLFPFLFIVGLVVIGGLLVSSSPELIQTATTSTMGTLQVHVNTTIHSSSVDAYGAAAYQSNSSGSWMTGRISSVEIFTSDTHASIARGETDVQGDISFELSEGTYIVHASANGNGWCDKASVHIQNSTTTYANISCIRYIVPVSN